MLVVISIVGMMAFADALTRAALGIFGSFAAALGALSFVQARRSETRYVREDVTVAIDHANHAHDGRQVAAG